MPSSMTSGTEQVTATPEQLSRILLADGWHSVQNCSFVQFGLGKAASPPSVSKLYPSISYTDKQSQKEVIIPLSQILGYEFNDTYSNNQSKGSSSQQQR